MNWYSKDAGRKIAIYYTSDIGAELADRFHNAIRENNITVEFERLSKKNSSTKRSDRTIVIDADSAIALSAQREKYCVFHSCPYQEVDEQRLSASVKREKLTLLHNALSRSAGIFATTEACRFELQTYHSQFVGLIPIPATRFGLPHEPIVEDVVVQISRHTIGIEVLGSLLQFDPLGVGTSYDLQQTEAPFRTRDIDDRESRRIQPRVMIVFGYDCTWQTPFRTIDAVRSGTVVINVFAPTMIGEGICRQLPRDCIGFFEAQESLESAMDEACQFISTLLQDKLFFDSVLSAQRRYLAAQNQYYEGFIREVIGK